MKSSLEWSHLLTFALIDSQKINQCLTIAFILQDCLICVVLFFSNDCIYLLKSCISACISVNVINGYCKVFCLGKPYLMIYFLRNILETFFQTGLFRCIYLYATKQYKFDFALAFQNKRTMSS